MLKPSTVSSPRLAPPGAGLPRVELLVARVLFAWQRRSLWPAAAGQKIAAERADIERLVRRCDPAGGAQRVLIKRPVGLEDSSRVWSVFMTLDHLRIVNLGIAGTIRELVAGRVPPGVVSTATVKPSPEVGPEVISAFGASCEELIAAGAGAPTLRTQVRHAHPWFGPLDAAGWRVMGAVHLGLHRPQIERILAGLAPTGQPEVAA